MNPLIEVARQIVEWRTLARTSGDLGKEGFARVRELIDLGFPDAIQKNEEALASAFIESQEALGEALKLLDQCAEACERSYNVNDWPADGDTIQDHAASAARAFLSKHKDKDNG